ncbi:carbohydrate ABC transporter permease [Ruminococcus sp.]|uniref:carbohydrate ABC transporter permease n=1 Tax=Ruminococcus sp. TaxID=41978 RepID=UPI001B4527D4|nr:carbohydrate ABC transporter permease [Ruminococcus sp.]MBP5432351.1 carbohydrate ABC transporter permease [Ruminococcus sp.]
MKLKRLTLRHKRRVFNCMILVFIFLAALVFLMPTVLTIANSFMTSKEITSNYGAMFKNMISGKKDIISENVNLKFIPDKVTFAQYKAVLIQNSDYLMKFWNSVILTVPITVFQMLVAILTSYGFSRYPNKFKSIIFFAYIILMIMPYQVTLVPNFLVADKFNMLDTRKAIILPAIFSPFSIFLLTKVMRRIPVSYVEAAKLDGASELKILTKIYVPLCKGAIVSISMLVFIDYWNMVEQPIVLMKNNNLHPLSVFLSEINTGDIGLAFAVGTVYMIPTVLMFLYGEDYLVEGISYSGGIKG